MQGKQPYDEPRVHVPPWRAYNSSTKRLALAAARPSRI
jgi:hypothetical protein